MFDKVLNTPMIRISSQLISANLYQRSAME